MDDARELFVFAAGNQLFAVPANEVAGTAERTVPAKLPLAPPTVLGVICVRGRMLTVLNATALVNPSQSETPAVLPLVVVLRGDEQLALGADRQHDPLQVRSSEIRPIPPIEETATRPGKPLAESAILGSVLRDNRNIVILNPRKLFAAAMGKSERRRRRT